MNDCFLHVLPVDSLDCRLGWSVSIAGWSGCKLGSLDYRLDWWENIADSLDCTLDWSENTRKWRTNNQRHGENRRRPCL
jgi:hypothetical protein